MTTLADMTTLRVGGPARAVLDTHSREDFLAAIRDVDGRGDALLVLGGGSNVLVGDDGFDGVVVRDRRERGPEVVRGDDHVDVTLAAGTDWDGVVALAVDQGWSGITALSGIPGSVGATPVQNVGAYGQEICDVLVAVTAWDRRTQRLRRMDPGSLRFGYRTSRLKQQLLGVTPRWVVVDVTLRLPCTSASDPVHYAQLADHLGVAVGQRVELAAMRSAVLELRAAKGMVLDHDDHDTWSAGSFFTNPILAPGRAARLPAAAPRWPQANGTGIKTSAAWLIQQAGFQPGHGLPGPAALSTKHTLAVTNRGGATARDLVALASQVRQGVRQTFGITLHTEPMLVGTSLVA